MPRARGTVPALVAFVALLALLLPPLAVPGSAAPEGAPIVTNFQIRKYATTQPACPPLGNVSGSILDNIYFREGDCGVGSVAISEAPPVGTVEFRFIGPAGGAPFAEEPATANGARYVFAIRPVAAWPAGQITVQAYVSDTLAGEATFFSNQLGADLQTATPGPFTPGAPVDITGRIAELRSEGLNTTTETAVPATFSLRVMGPEGAARGPFGPYTAAPDGNIAVTLPPEATAGYAPTAETGFRLSLSVAAVDASYTDPSSGDWAAAEAGTGAINLATPPNVLLLDNSFVSSVGWVKPGEEYPFRLILRNLTGQPRSGARVTVPPVDGTTFVSATPVGGAGPATIGPDGTLTWDQGAVPTGTVDEPAVVSLVVVARVDTLGQDAQIAWKNLSTAATLAADGEPARTVPSHGPKVIPPSGTYESARYGDRPFPVVPVDFRDRKHEPANSGAALARQINDPANPGSTFNLFQEMSYGQLFPDGTVPSNGVASAPFDPDHEYRFTTNQIPPPSTCGGTTQPEARGTALLPDRIDDGYYQLPGDTGYYGSDRGGSAASPVASAIDGGCGDAGKAVYDAAVIADEDIDYNDFDTDKDGVVDFFMMVFVGCGGNLESQTGCFGETAPYDNIWPHSSTLEGGFIDETTGLAGYISDDPLLDLQGRRLHYTDASYTSLTPTVTAFPAFVRVGPYNVNPETAIERASVISHEYGHSLGLPDYYSGAGAAGATDFYADWNLMAADYSQNMDVQARQELGWLIPRPLPMNTTSELQNLVETKTDTNRIDWQSPDGTPYTLTGPGVHNGTAYGVKLPARILIDPDLVANGGSLPNVWWSGSGDSFNCPPGQGHNLDFVLPQLATVEPGTEVTLEYSSYWDIEWDYDYGFTTITTDGGDSYAALPSEQGYTTPGSNNPNSNTCQAALGNGLTGTSGSYQAGTQDLDRLQTNQVQGDEFLRDSYDLSAFAGEEQATLRFSYTSDVGTARPGWFIDDLVVKAGDEVLYEANFTDDGGPADEEVYNGGCNEDLRTGPVCTDGWTYVDAEEGSPADHAYYFELRDRTGFDFDGRGQSDRGALTWMPGVSLAFTDEVQGYGNSSREDRPNQHVIDSVPQPGNLAPNLTDAAFVAQAGRNRFSDSGEGYVDNYEDPQREDNRLRFDFNCLSLDVLGLTGTDVGPLERPGNLAGSLRATTGPGCRAWDYGYGQVTNAAPTARISARPVPGVAGSESTFDASESFDDLSAPTELTFAWDLDGDGRTDATGSQATTTFPTPGRYPVKLTVTDEGALTGTATLPYDVVAAGAQPSPTPTPTATPGPSEPTPVPTTAPPGEEITLRIAGSGRVETAVEISRGAFETAPTAVLARADDFPDALAAAALAAQVGGPVLLTDRDQLSPLVAEELERLGTAEVVLAGGTAALSVAIADELAADGREVTRLGGADRFETAALIARDMVRRGGPVIQAIVARADDFADALAAGNLAAQGRAPILLTNTTQLPDVTAAVISELTVERVHVAGGTAAVAPPVLDELTAMGGFAVARLSGPNRFATAVAITEEAVAQGADRIPTLLASGGNFPDALAAGPAAHQLGGVLLLVHPTDLAASEASASYLAQHRDEIDVLLIVGGTAAVSQTVQDAATAAVQDG